MRKRILRFSILVMLVVAVIGAWAVINKNNYVNAAGDKDITLGEKYALEFDGSDKCWFRLQNNTSKMVKVIANVKEPVEVSLYKDSKEGSMIGNLLCFNEQPNYSLMSYLEQGTYYFQARSLYSNDTYAGATIVFADITDTTPVATINATNFPNALFRKYVEVNFDVRSDGIITKDEVLRATNITIHDPELDDFKGIEYFTELSELSCYGTSITSLDLSKNTKLTDLNCYDIKDLKSLNVSKCAILSYIDCESCDLSALDLSGCKELSTLYCCENPLTKLDLSNHRSLTELDCSDTDISELKVNGCYRLRNLDCFGTNLTSLDVSGLDDLNYLYCHHNSKLKTLKINKDIKCLSCGLTALTSLDLSGCSSLEALYIKSTQISQIDISDCPGLVMLYNDKYKVSDGTYKGKIGNDTYGLSFDAGTKIITSDEADEKVVELTSDNFPDSNFMSFIQNYDADGDGGLSKSEIKLINSLVLSGLIKDLKGIEYLTELKELELHTTMITNIDLSKNSKLKTLKIDHNVVKIEKLNLNSNKNLIRLAIQFTSVNGIDISKNTNLDELSLLGVPGVDTLDISNNGSVSYLSIVDTDIKKLDISNCPKLLDAYRNLPKQEEKYIGQIIDMYYDYDINIGLAVDHRIVIIVPKPTATPTPTAKPTATPTAKPTAKPTGASSVTLTLDKKTANVTCGKTLALKATLKGSSSKITWKSSDNKIATVDANGKITSKMAGQVTITASAAGKSAKCVVTVLYKDVTNSKDFWYAPTNYLTAKGVVKGYDKQTKFKPANDCTRAQMVTFLYRLQGEPKVKSTTCKFKDVKKTDYFFKPVIWASEKGITTGVSKDKFGPQGVCTRAQTVTFLWRMAKKPAPVTKKNKFPDVKKSDYFYKATLWASEKKILAGLPDGTFNPQGKCLRRQMVTFLYKYDKKINSK